MSLLCFQHTKELAINGKDVATIVVISMFFKKKEVAIMIMTVLLLKYKRKRISNNEYNCYVLKFKKLTIKILTAVN